MGHSLSYHAIVSIYVLSRFKLKLSPDAIHGASSFNHGHGFPTPETPKQRPHLVERGNRDHEPREGDLERNAGQGLVPSVFF